MRILLLSDIHGNLHEIEAVLADAESKGLTFQSILQLGDFGVWPGDKGRRFLDGVSALAVRTGVPFRFLGGNHEDYDQIDSWGSGNSPFTEVRDGLFYVQRGARWTWGKCSFGSLGGAFSVDHKIRTPHVDWWPRSEEVHVEDVLTLGPRVLDVLVSHTTGFLSSPKRQPAFLSSGSKVNISRETEMMADTSEYLVQLAMDHTQPKWLFHGHWHYINMSQQKYHDSSRITNVLGFECMDSRYGAMSGYPENCYAIFDTDDMTVQFRGQVLETVES